ncbi:MAG: hypothetical protein AAF655_20260 [Bacteroidota bacterium]
MRNVFFLIFSLLLFPAISVAQLFPPPEEGKAVVYFVRPSGLGAAINFQLYHEEVFIGKFNGVNYMRYECEAGEHVFWARAENRSFVNADLLANKSYIIELVPQMGAIKAGVKLFPIKPNEKRLKKIHKLLEKKSPREFSEEFLQEQQLKFQDDIAKGLDKYKLLNGKQSPAIKVLSAEDYHEDEGKDALP